MFQEKINGDYVINPKTSRPVKVGSAVWMTLIKAGILKNTIKDKKELYELGTNDDVEKVKYEINQRLPMTQHAVRGRGRYENKIVVREKQPTAKDILSITKKSTARVLQDDENIKNLQKLNEDDWENELSNMILEEINKPSKITKSKPIKIIKKNEVKQSKYKIKEPEPETDEYEENSDEGFYEN